MAALLTNLCVVATAASAAPRHSPALNYLMHCQGCHKDDGSGQPGYVPALRDSVSRFLAIPEGRAYLGRVPGTSQSLLDDHDRAEVLNWIVKKFDPQDLPATFIPYTEQELARYRRDVLSLPGAERAKILKLIASSEGAGPSESGEPAPATAGASPKGASIDPPPQFALCGACHPTSTDGASAMGPNLRGVFGRRAGTLSGFGYSAAMRAAQIQWNREALNAYLENPAARIPGNMMAYGGMADANERAAIIDYLEQLR
jgi:cytochrome c2